MASMRAPYFKAAMTAILGLVAMLVSACADHTLVHDTVLRPGQSVSASNRAGRVRIVYLGPATRRFEIDGRSKTIRMTQRPEMFDRRSGIYDPADWFWPWRPSLRIVCDESVINFETIDELYAFLGEQRSMDWVYTPDGLVIGFDRTPSRYQVNVDVYQLLVRGEKPNGLRGARPYAIQLKNGPNT